MADAIPQHNEGEAKNERRKTAARGGPNGATTRYESELWAMADKLRGNMEPSDYKHVALGLIFLKYISDAFEAKRADLLREELADAEDPEEYLAENVFWVPKAARWSRLQAGAKQTSIGKDIDDAMLAIEASNASLKGVLPKDYARPALNKVMLGELIDLVSGIGMAEEADPSRDILGRVYEYFLGGFAGAEGKRGGEFYTPRSVVRLLVEMLEPYKGRVYDPCWAARHHPPTVEYVDLSATKWGNIEAATLLDWEAAPSRARRIAEAGDTILGTTRPGNGSFAYIPRDGLTVSTGSAVLSPRSPMYRDAVYIAATSVENIERLANLADGHGGAYPAVKPTEVTDTVIMFPGDQVLASFADLVSPIREKIEHAKAESQTLAQTRDRLLPKLMSGEIRLVEAEKAVAAAA